MCHEEPNVKKRQVFNLSESSKILKIGRETLIRYMNKFGIKHIKNANDAQSTQVYITGEDIIKIFLLQTNTIQA